MADITKYGESYFFAAEPPSDIEMLAAAAAHGLMKITELREKNKDMCFPKIWQYLADFEYHLADPEYDVAENELRQLRKHLTAIHMGPTEILIAIHEQGYKCLEQLHAQDRSNN